MALLFTADDFDAVYVNTAVISGTNFAVSAWIRPDTSGTRMLGAIQDKDASNKYHHLMLTSEAPWPAPR